MKYCLLIRNMACDIEDDRVRVKDDVKLVAQCDCKANSHLISEDAGTLAKYIKRANEGGMTETKAVLLKHGFKEVTLKTVKRDWLDRNYI